MISIAIDGPAGAGKSTLAKALASKLGYIYIDTGAMYRTVALWYIRKGIDTKDRDAMLPRLNDFVIDVRNIDGVQHMFLDGEDVNGLIRTPEVSMGASNVAVVPEVRLKLVEIQRQLASRNDVIMDGRDIGTYVLPNAQLKIFLSATPEARARRRFLENTAKGIETPFEEVLADMIARDKQDTERAFAPLKAAEDAVMLDNTTMTVEETIVYITGLLEKIG
ncbi:MAG: (d)CMP kinase [Clostridia bacterium]|nr:(d)CMP kinase [Clostridia bacterium]